MQRNYPKAQIQTRYLARQLLQLASSWHRIEVLLERLRVRLPIPYAKAQPKHQEQEQISLACMGPVIISRKDDSTYAKLPAAFVKARLRIRKTRFCLGEPVIAVSQVCPIAAATWSPVGQLVCVLTSRGQLRLQLSDLPLQNRTDD